MKYLITIAFALLSALFLLLGLNETNQGAGMGWIITATVSAWIALCRAIGVKRIESGEWK